MVRKAIIICSPGGTRNLDYLPGVSIDAVNYFSFLSSRAGGNWKDEELLIMQDPDSVTLLSIIEKIKVDYFFLSFNGHGEFSNFSKSDYICLRDKNLPIYKLRSNSDKQTIIVDAFRKKRTNLPISIGKTMNDKSINTIEESLSRNIFDLAIENTPKGVIFIYCKQPSEIAGEDENKGGHFTFSLIKAGQNWWENTNNKGLLRLDMAVQNAALILKETFKSTQKPIMGGQIRRLTFPPFAVSQLFC